MRTSRSARREGLNCRIDRGPLGGVSAKAATNATAIASAIAPRPNQAPSTQHPARHQALRTQHPAPSLLFSFQSRQVGRFRFGYESLVSIGIDERIRLPLLQRTRFLRLGFEVEH